MLKMVFLVHRRHGMDIDSFREYWRETHAPIAANLPELRRYVQNHAVSGEGDGLPAFDGFAEMWWDDADAMQRSLASPEGQAALNDTANFLDPDRMVTFSVEQAEIVWSS
ncbi:MAG TPA: EthD family reductase [Acidobacteriota bacterium]|jgi:uncharacterized protein (TIGR02118 family)